MVENLPLFAGAGFGLWWLWAKQAPRIEQAHEREVAADAVISIQGFCEEIVAGTSRLDINLTSSGPR